MMPNELSALELAYDQRQVFDSRPDIGPTEGLLERFMRYLQGNPISYQRVTSPISTQPETLPAESRARVAVCTVLNAACFYRTDGSNPAGAPEQSLPVGAIVYLYGQASINGFIFTAVGTAASTLAVTYYD